MVRFDVLMPENERLKSRKLLHQNQFPYPDILQITGEFQIVINENLFFKEPYFPILEFLKDALSWVKCSDNLKEMAYSSLETEDNPLITFLKKDEDWIIYSPWQKFKCSVVFTKEELTNSILYLVKKLTD